MGWPLYPGASEYDQVGVDVALGAGKCTHPSPFSCQGEQMPAFVTFANDGSVFPALPSQPCHYAPGVFIPGKLCAAWNAAF